MQSDKVLEVEVRVAQKLLFKDETKQLHYARASWNPTSDPILQCISNRSINEAALLF